MSTPAKIIDLNLPTVALVGRVNVGKSTLFNRLTESNKAIVSPVAGTTRTRNIGLILWRGKKVRLVDTGGLTFDEKVPLEENIIEQTEIALKEADLVLFVTDVTEGIYPQEKELAKRLKLKHKDKPLIFVANKADGADLRMRVHDRDWLKLGFGEPTPVSAQNGSGTGDLLDTIFTHLNKMKIRPKKVREFNPIRVALVGKPNVGKSTLFNKLIGEERVIVSDMPHTTREPHDTLVEVEGLPMLFVDTAGIRKKTKVSGELEKYGIGKSIQMINRSDVVLLILDASEPVTDQDQQLAGLLREHTRSVIIVINKWDKAEDNDDSFRNEVKKSIYGYFPHLDFAPIAFVSAKSSYRIHQIFPLIIRAWNERRTVLSDATLHEFIKNATRKHLPSRGKGVRHPEILGLTQIRTDPPLFDMKIKNKTSVNISYVHYIENRLREQFSFFATPIIIKLSKMKKRI
ncbi:ribosome biogenesis GTPase Der [Patescibacteria group bacterium]|nr:ribosome biogenesis GTPase Der [Patescibacteria group bacterium]